MSDLINFKAWYADVLKTLYPDRNAGIAVFMLSYHWQSDTFDKRTTSTQTRL